MSLLILGSLGSGVAAQLLLPFGRDLGGALAAPLVVALLTLIGVQMGSDLSWLRTWRSHLRLTLLISACTVAGSLGVAGLYASLDPGMGVRDGLLVASGMSFYSLSSVLLSQAGHHGLAVLSLLSNLLREVLSLAAAPVIVRLFGTLAPIAATASASDSGAPVITRVSGAEHAALCVSTAFVLSLCVPVLVHLLLP